MNGDLLTRFDAHLQASGRSASTRKHYTYYVRRCARECGRSLERLSVADGRRWLEGLASRGILGTSAFRLAHYSCSAFFSEFLKRKRVDLGPKPQSPKRPGAITVLSVGQVLRLLAAVTDKDHRLVLLSLYLTGMRIGDGVGLRRDDLLWEQGMIRIRDQKGGGGRLVPMSETLKSRLHTHCTRLSGSPYVFPRWGDARRPVARDTVQRAMREARQTTGLPEWATPHTLRHSFATHQLQAGLDVRSLAAILGHSSLKPTMRYLHYCDLLEGTPRRPFDLGALLLDTWKQERGLDARQGVAR